MKTDISAIITAHREGVLAGLSLASIYENIEEITRAGYSSEVIVILDNADQYTRAVFKDIESSIPIRTFDTEYGDQGLVRNFAVSKAKGTYSAFLDGDDLWSANWLIDCLDFIRKEPDNAILHPEFNWFFGGQSSLMINISDDDDLFDSKFMRAANYWDALCFARTKLFKAHPYCKRRLDEGFAYEDWHWNCVTLTSCKHLVVPDTIHFKRRREDSQTMRASQSRALPPSF